MDRREIASIGLKSQSFMLDQGNLRTRWTQGQLSQCTDDLQLREKRGRNEKTEDETVKQANHVQID